MMCFAGRKKTEEDTEQAVEKEGSDTESAEETTAKDETDDKTNGNDEKKEDKKGGMVNRVTTYLSAMKNSMKKPKDIKYTAETPESEMKLHENEEKKEGDDSVVYADLDKSALGSGNRDRPNVDSESTEY